MSAYSNEYLLRRLQALAAELGHPPSTTELDEEGFHSSRLYIKRFGDWETALEKAGLSTEDVGKKIPRQSLIEALETLGENLNHPPRTADIHHSTPYSVQTYRNRFESLEAALTEAGLSPENVGSLHTKAELLDELRRLADDLDQPPSTRDMEVEGKYTYESYLERFSDWETAITAAGLDPDDIHNRLSIDDLLAELEYLKEKLNKTPAKWDMTHHGQYSPAPYIRRYGAWDKALEAAGMEPANATNQIPNKTLEKDLRRLVRKYGRDPTWEEIRTDGGFSPSTYNDRYGSLKTAIAAAIASPPASGDKLKSPNSDELTDQRSYNGP